MIWVLLVAIGLFVGAFGTLIGVAGGFLLIPILLFLYPEASPAVITSITLTVAFFNALSGTIAYFRLKRVDVKSGLLFALTAVPGAILGAYLINYLNRDVFQYVFGSILLLVSLYLLLRPNKKLTSNFLSKWQISCSITDRQNNVCQYSYNLPLGMFIAFFVGVVAGLLGIGGGIIHVPMLTQILGFPTHIATATSHFIVAITTFSAIDTHLIGRTFTSDIGVAMVLSAGAVVGAQFGARLSHKVSGTLIIRLLAVGLAIVALRLLIAPF
ncbi:MAG: sulfite exporter TauE/SafE family protein [Dehalococcoidales bacterium]